jgi:hypothetical protein
MKTKPMTLKAFQKAVADICIQHGGTVPYPEDAYAMSLYHVPTLGGLFNVKAQDDWIACRFEDVSKARSERIANVSEFTGKGNFHGFPNTRADTVKEFSDFLQRYSLVF